MHIRKYLHRLIKASLIAGSLTIGVYPLNILDCFPISVVSTAHAQVQTYTGVGEDYSNEFESQEIAKQRARRNAIKNATEQAGVYLQTYSKSISGNLTADEISAITSGSYQIIGDVHYESIIKQETDTITVIIWKATVKVNVDDTEVRNWLNRDAQNRTTIVSQNNAAQRAAYENDRQVENLNKRAQSAVTDAERAAVKAEYEQADNEFFMIQYFEEGIRLYYQQDYTGAVDKFNKAVQLNPNFSESYYNRGVAYYFLKNYNAAIADFNKYIELNPNDADAYYNRGTVYFDIENDEAAIADYTMAIKLNPQYLEAYINRGLAYALSDNFGKAIADFTKAISINPNDGQAYKLRGAVYQMIGDNMRAEADFAKAKQLGYND